MKKESLEEARKIVITSINQSLINEIDRTELIINLHHFLDANKYEENIKNLQKSKNYRKFK